MSHSWREAGSMRRSLSVCCIRVRGSPRDFYLRGGIHFLQESLDQKADCVLAFDWPCPWPAPGPVDTTQLPRVHALCSTSLPCPARPEPGGLHSGRPIGSCSACSEQRPLTKRAFLSLRLVLLPGTGCDGRFGASKILWPSLIPQDKAVGLPRRLAEAGVTRTVWAVGEGGLNAAGLGTRVS